MSTVWGWLYLAASVILALNGDRDVAAFLFIVGHIWLVGAKVTQAIAERGVDK